MEFLEVAAAHPVISMPDVVRMEAGRLWYRSDKAGSEPGEKSMSRFEWQKVETAYQELRPSDHAEELRWIVNRETILDRTTGITITRGAIRHPGICVVVPFLDADHILLMHQYRYAAGQALWEVPAGTMSGRLENARVLPVETPEFCARRELVEETGYEARKLEKVCECYTMPGTSDELMHVFFAYQLIKREPSRDVGEVIEEVRSLSLREIGGMIDRGEIHDAKTFVGLFYALRHASNQ
jgi:ADP-ribose pyrophosphatase